jgi:rRNA-processing protein FCF1
MDTSFLLFAANNPIQYSNSILDLKSFQIIILEDVINELIGISKDKGIMRSRNALNALAYTKTLIHQKVDKNTNTDDKILLYARQIDGIIASLDGDLLLQANKNGIDTVSVKKGMLIWKVTHAK